MDKEVYDLRINDDLQHVMPPLQDKELELLTESLLTEGCRDPLVVWNGVVVDGYNRYRICHEHNIPFSYVEIEFTDEAAASRWIIRNQLARRNLPDFVKCEMVLPLEDEFRAQGKRRQGWKKEQDDLLVNLPKGKIAVNTRDTLAEMAGVSGKTFDKAKKLISSADEETKEKLRNREMSINKAFAEMKAKERTAPAEEPAILPAGESIKIVPEIIPDGKKVDQEEQTKPDFPDYEEDDDLPFKYVGGHYATFAECVADMKNMDKDCSSSPDLFLAELTSFVSKLLPQIQWYSDDYYMPVFPELTERQMNYLRGQLDLICSAADDLYKLVERTRKNELQKKTRRAKTAKKADAGTGDHSLY